VEKTELIKRLAAIEGNPEISFVVDNDEILDDYPNTIFDEIYAIKLEQELIYDDVIYFNKKKLKDHIENISFFEHGELLDAHIEEIKKTAKHKIFIRIGV
jgi:hypothetical protein